MHFLILRRLLASSWRMFMALVLGLIGFILTFVYDPDLLNQMISLARSFVEGMVEQFGQWGLSAKYTVWLNILNVADKLVFMGFVIAARIFMALFTLAFFSLPYQLFKKVSSPAPAPETSATIQETTSAARPAATPNSPPEAANQTATSPEPKQPPERTAQGQSHAPDGSRAGVPKSPSPSSEARPAPPAPPAEKPKKDSLAKRLENLPQEDG